MLADTNAIDARQPVKPKQKEMDRMCAGAQNCGGEEATIRRT